MIKAITLSALRNSEFAQFVSDVLGMVERNGPDAMQVQEEFDKLKAGYDVLIDLLKPIKAHVLTSELEAADSRRDMAINGISTVISGYTNHYDPSVSDHAKNLQRQLDVYGTGIARLNYQSETSTLTSLVADFKGKPEMTAAIAALNLTDWLNELDTANKAFNALYLKRAADIGTNPPESVRDKRLRIADDYYNLRDMVNSYHIIKKGAEPYATTINQVNVIIDKYNVLIADRKAAKEEGEVSVE